VCLLAAVLVLTIAPAVAGIAPAEGSSPPVRKVARLKKLTLEQLFDLEVTSVSQKPEALSRTAAAIHVVTQSDLRQMGASSIPEALRDIPGVEVARVNSREYAITARGFNSTTANKLLVLIDGRSVYTPLFSGVFWDVQDTFLEDVEQIEVIRGPGATVWGSNAVNGVINVRTRDAAHTQGLLISGGGGNAERGFGGARFGGTLGSRGFFRVHGKHFDRAASLLGNGQDAGDGYRMSQSGFRADWTAPGGDQLSAQGDAYFGDVQQPAQRRIELGGGNLMAHWKRQVSATWPSTAPTATFRRSSPSASTLTTPARGSDSPPGATTSCGGSVTGSRATTSGTAPSSHSCRAT
jgi:iron complex outermembrane receptor protein